VAIFKASARRSARRAVHQRRRDPMFSRSFGRGGAGAVPGACQAIRANGFVFVAGQLRLAPVEERSSRAASPPDGTGVREQVIHQAWLVANQVVKRLCSFSAIRGHERGIRATSARRRPPGRRSRSRRCVRRARRDQPSRSPVERGPQDAGR
jgi:hypothetical protein